MSFSCRKRLQANVFKLNVTPASLLTAHSSPPPFSAFPLSPGHPQAFRRFRLNGGSSHHRTVDCYRRQAASERQAKTYFPRQICRPLGDEARLGRASRRRGHRGGCCWVVDTSCTELLQHRTDLKNIEAARSPVGSTRQRLFVVVCCLDHDSFGASSLFFSFFPVFLVHTLLSAQCRDVGFCRDVPCHACQSHDRTGGSWGVHVSGAWLGGCLSRVQLERVFKDGSVLCSHEASVFVVFLFCWPLRWSG